MKEIAEAEADQGLAAGVDVGLMALNQLDGLGANTRYGRRQWTTPGGRVEAGESPLGALHREVWGESACRIARIRR